MVNKLTDLLLTYRGIKLYSGFLAESQYWSPAQIKERQSLWLTRLLQHCKTHIPWYSGQFRMYGVNTNSTDPFAELNKLPVLTKDQVRQNHSLFCLANAKSDSLSFATSGTTGEPLRVHTSQNQWIYEQGVIWRHWKWAGYQFRDKIAIFRSYAPTADQPLIKVDSLKNWSYFSVFRMDDQAMQQYFAYMQKWQPKYLRGYPSALKLVAQYAIRHRIKLPGLKGAFTASEKVTPDVRESLREAFGIEVFDHYGQAEITCMFHECEKHEGMHVDWEYGLVELLDSGVPGKFRIVATNLHNLSMPLLRYDTGDLSYGGWEACTCGRSAPVIRGIDGRSDHYLLFSDGSRASTVNLYTYFSKISDLKRFQVIQSAPGQLSIKYSIWNAADKSAATSLGAKIVQDLSGMMNMQIRTECTDEYRLSREGKFATFVQLVDSDVA